jgi:hypothetical protein
MTPALELLVKTRRIKTEKEVEQEFQKQQKLLQLQGPASKEKKDTT